MSLRIISGKLKGKKLHTLRGTKVRPTADRLRESIFNILSARIQQTTVLDLFAGTGAMGLEAISRGAKSAVFVENNRQALSVVARNIEACNFSNQTKIIRWNIRKNLNCIQACNPAFDLVFIDPPYNQNIIHLSLLNLFESGSLKPGACIVLEHAVEEPLRHGLEAFEMVDQRRYGKTLVSFLNYVV